MINQLLSKAMNNISHLFLIIEISSRNIKETFPFYLYEAFVIHLDRLASKNREDFSLIHYISIIKCGFSGF